MSIGWSEDKPAFSVLKSQRSAPRLPFNSFPFLSLIPKSLGLCPYLPLLLIRYNWVSYSAITLFRTRHPRLRTFGI
eukprot:5188394-Pleurochrysis_carterae.AAC.1